MGDTKSRPRRTPVAGGVFDGEMPETGTRRGFWKDQFNDVLSQNPGVVYTYTDVSESTASNLRGDYGLTCATKTEDGVLTLYVKWVPEDAERIKRETAERGAKRKATVAANKAAKEAAGNRQARQPAASRS